MPADALGLFAGHYLGKSGLHGAGNEHIQAHQIPGTVSDELVAVGPVARGQALQVVRKIHQDIGQRRIITDSQAIRPQIALFKIRAAGLCQEFHDRAKPG